MDRSIAFPTDSAPHAAQHSANDKYVIITFSPSNPFFFSFLFNTLLTNHRFIRHQIFSYQLQQVTCKSPFFFFFCFSRAHRGLGLVSLFPWRTPGVTLFFSSTLSDPVDYTLVFVALYLPRSVHGRAQTAVGADDERVIGNLIGIGSYCVAERSKFNSIHDREGQQQRKHV
jgi:hypothetical protein